MIIDCLKFKGHSGHFNLAESLRISNYLKPKKTILTNLHTDLDYNFLKKNLISNEIVICMGAGSISKWLGEIRL